MRELIGEIRARLGCCYAVKVPFCKWTGVKALINAQARRVHRQSPRNYQLDLFSPDDGYCEYSAVATNLSRAPQALWRFAAGRGAQEKTFAELKGEFALALAPTNHYGANSAWLQLSILAHNRMRGCQLQSTLATPKPRSRQRAYSYRIASMKTLRCRLINRAARVARISGKKVRRFSANSATAEPFMTESHTASLPDLFSN